MKHLYLLLFSLILVSCAEPQPKLNITVSNPLNLDRTNETVEIHYAALQEKLPLADTGYTYVVLKDGKEIPSQLVYAGEEVPQLFIFQATIKANSMETYTVSLRKKPVAYESKAYGRFAPERYDDYFWENDFVAFRIYGLALIAKDGPSNGLDFLVKHTDKFFMDKIYKDYTENKISYHVDHGLGVDCYKVGRSLGCGAMAPFVNNKLWLGQNFAGYKMLDNGPIRTSVKLTYDAFDVNGAPVTEIRIFSLDAGAQLNKVTEIFGGMAGSFPVAAGIVLKNAGIPVDMDKADKNHTPVLAPEKGYVIYSEEADKSKPEHENGVIYTAVVFPEALTAAKVEQQHVLAVGDYKGPFTYYTGGGWSKRNFDTPEKWTEYVNDFAAKIRQPLQVNF